MWRREPNQKKSDNADSKMNCIWMVTIYRKTDLITKLFTSRLKAQQYFDSFKKPGYVLKHIGIYPPGY